MVGTQTFASGFKWLWWIYVIVVDLRGCGGSTWLWWIYVVVVDLTLLVGTQTFASRLKN